MNKPSCQTLRPKPSACPRADLAVSSLGPGGRRSLIGVALSGPYDPWGHSRHADPSPCDKLYETHVALHASRRAKRQFARVSCPGLRTLGPYISRRARALRDVGQIGHRVCMRRPARIANPCGDLRIAGLSASDPVELALISSSISPPIFRLQARRDSIGHIGRPAAELYPLVPRGEKPLPHSRS